MLCELPSQRGIMDVCIDAKDRPHFFTPRNSYMAGRHVFLVPPCKGSDTCDDLQPLAGNDGWKRKRDVLPAWGVVKGKQFYAIGSKIDLSHLYQQHRLRNDQEVSWETHNKGELLINLVKNHYLER